MVLNHNHISALKSFPLAKHHPVEEVLSAKPKMKAFIGLKRSLCVPEPGRQRMGSVSASGNAFTRLFVIPAQEEAEHTQILN